MKNVKKIAEEILKVSKKIWVVQYDKSKKTENEFKNYLKEYNAKVSDWTEKDYGLRLEIELPSNQERSFLRNLSKKFKEG